MNRPKLRFNGFTDDWVQRKLGDVLQFQNGFNGGREAYGEGTAFISVMDILNNQFITYDCIRGKATVSDDELERFAVRYGDVLFQRSSENVEDAGTSNVYIDRDNTAIFGGFVIRGKQIAPYSPKFMKYLLDTKLVRNQITKKAQGAQHVNVSQETLQDVQISLPSQEEQVVIENCLYNLDNLIALHQRKCDNLKEVKKYMLQKMFPKNGEKVPEIRFAGFTGDWEQRKLGEITDSYSGGTPTAGKAEYYGGSIPFIRSAEVNSETTELFLTEEGLKNSSAKMVKKGDILYALYGATSGEVGLARLDGAINQAILDIKPHEDYDAPFIMHWLRKSKESIIGTYLQGGQGNLSGTLVTSLMVDCPTYDEQKQIGVYLSTIDNLVALHHRKLDKLNCLKKAYLSEMFPAPGERKPRRRFAGFTGDWVQRKVGDLAEVNPKSAIPDEFEYVDLESVVGTEIIAHRTESRESAPSRAQRLATAGDVFYQTVRPYQKNNCLFEGADESYVFSTGYAQLRPVGDSYFLLTMLQRDNFVNDVLDRCTGTSYPAINANVLADLSVSCPVSLQEQEKIGRHFKNLDNLITLHQRKCDDLREVKKYMLQNMFP